MSSSNDCTIEILIQQRESPINEHFLDEIRSERRLAKCHLISKVSAISSNNLDVLVYQRRNALTKEKTILNSLDQN